MVHMVPPPTRPTNAMQCPPGSKLQLGCGGKAIEGYINTDGRLDKSPAGFTVDVLKDPLPNSTFAEIYYCHGMEHVYKDQAIPTLRRLLAALQPNGILRLSVPDLRLILLNCVEGHAFGPDPDPPLFGDYYSTAQEWDRHKRSYTKESLTAELLAAGFIQVTPWYPAAVPAILAAYDWSCYDTISLNLLAKRSG